ncbi:MAG: polysaccharide biosynthesis tyrosine autokinase [Actinomycetota bacterium]|nr:polysaccharide biosynthesis tyrosine autokinase [Actinomycetota bacterium]
MTIGNGRENDEAVDIREYIAILRVRKWTIAISTLAASLLALGFSFLQTPLYTAEARLLVAPPLDDEVTVPAFAADLVQTEAQLVASQPVAALVKEDLDAGASLDQLLESLQVNPVGETRVLRVAYTSTDPRQGQRLANSFASSYLAFRRQMVLQRVLDERRAAERRVNAASAELADITQQVETARRSGDEGLITTLETQRNVLVARLGLLQQQLDEVAAEADQQGVGEVIEQASLPLAPSSPNYIVNGLLGAALGLAVGTGLAFLRERLQDRFRNPGDIERIVEAPLLATIPRYRLRRREGSNRVITLEQPTSVPSEAYRTLRTNVQFIAGQREIKSFVVTSGLAEEGKTATAVNLGVVLAHAGQRVIIVSADMRRPTLEGYFGFDQRPGQGLSTWLKDPHQAIWPYIIDPGIPNLRLLPSGPIPADPAELLSSRGLTDLTAMLEDNSDFVLFDAPPVLGLADATVIAARAGAVLLVIDAGKAHRSTSLRARAQLERVGGHVSGAVLNGVDESTAPYSYVPYGYQAYEPHEPVSSDNGGGSRRRRRLFSRRSS